LKAVSKGEFGKKKGTESAKRVLAKKDRGPPDATSGQSRLRELKEFKKKEREAGGQGGP